MVYRTIKISLIISISLSVQMESSLNMRMEIIQSLFRNPVAFWQKCIGFNLREQKSSVESKRTVHRANQLITKNQDTGFENGLLNSFIPYFLKKYKNHWGNAVAKDDKWRKRSE